MTARPWLSLIAITLGLFGLAGSRLEAQEPLYSGTFVDGTVVTGGKISEWHTPQPKLNGRPLFDDSKPIRWLRRESGETIPPLSYVEMFGGDRLPGRVIDFQSSGESQADRQPPHVVVKPEVSVDLPDQPTRQRLRVTVQNLRKVVWQRRSSDSYVPGTLFYADGRQVAFDRLNWSPGAVTLLLKEGTRKVAFGEIAELHLPRRSPWDVYFDTLALLSPDCASRLMRMETFAGLAATTSLARLHPKATSGDPNGWYHRIQPAWSLDLLWIRHTQVQSRRFFLPHEVALSMLEPQRVVQRASLGSGWNWQVDRNVKALPLMSAQKTFGWGFGVAAYSELEFELPPGVKAFRTQLGLDDAVGRGGCAKALIYVNKIEGQPLYQSKQLIGSAEIVDTGVISLGGPEAGQKSLLLVVDPAHADRPAGADPLDIRDLLDWLEPTLELDQDKLRAEVAKRLPRAVPAWEGWQVVLGEGNKLILNSRWVTYNPGDARLRFDSITTGDPLRFTRKVRPTAAQKYLLISADRFVDVSSPSQIEVLIDGQPYAKLSVPERRAGVPLDPQLISLESFADKQIQIEVVHSPTDAKSSVDWRALELVEYTTDTPWATLVARDKKSAGGASISDMGDGSLYVSGKHVDQDTYTVVAETAMQGITAIRLEALTDPRLQNNGPGRAGGGQFMLTNFTVTAEPRDKSAPAEPVVFERVDADHAPNDGPAAAAIDNSPQSGWAIWPQNGQPHVAIFTTKSDVGFASGTTLTFTLDHKQHAQHALGRFRLAATNVPRPVSVERPGQIVPIADHRPLVIFEDDSAMVTTLVYGNGVATLEPADKKFGAASIKLTGDQRFADNPPNFPIKVRQNPGPGEYRYLQFAWKKGDGKNVGFNLAHEGAWGAVGDKKFSYQAGPGAFSTSLIVDAALPAEWQVVTRDLFEDFGEFTWTGLGFTQHEGTTAWLDHVVLARDKNDFENAK